MVISQETIAEIRRRCDIVEVIGSYTSLSAKGRHLFALCPFHAEKTPSFSVNPQKQIFYCFGCGVGGDVFSFVMRREQVAFQEAVQILAAKAGVTLIQAKPKNPAEQTLKEKIYKLYALAAEFYQKQLLGTQGAEIREYLASRGIYNNAISRFGIGYAPTGWDNLLQHLTRQGFKPALLEEAGLVLPRTKGSGYYDRFRHRLIIPIINEDGQVQAFGGRALGDDQPKYLNSPESAVYHKGRGFYGLNWAKPAIRQSKRAILMEGYFDLISAHLNGFENAVATLGTAITADQVQKLSRMGTEEVIIFFDTDPAGLAAAMRSWGLFLESNLQVKVATLGELQEKEDPDSYLRKQGAEAFRQRLDLACSLVEFVLDQALKTNSLERSEGQINCLNQVLPVLACIKNPISRCNYLKLLEAKLKIIDKILLEELKKVVAKGQSRLKRPEAMDLTANIQAAPQLAERALIKLMLDSMQVAEKLVPQLNADIFFSPECQTLFDLIKANLSQASDWNLSILMGQIQDETAKTRLAALAMEDIACDDDPLRMAQDYIHTLEAARLKAKSEALGKEIKSLGQGSADENLLREYQNLQRKKIRTS